MKVAIIGGGIAGLTCAYRLNQKGIQCVLFDDSPYTGGRVEYCVSITTPSFQPSLYRLVDELGLKEAEVPFLPTMVGMLMGKDIVGFEDFPKMVAGLPAQEQSYFQKMMGDVMANSFDIDNPGPRLLELRKISFEEYLKDWPPHLKGMLIDPMMGFTFMEKLDLSKFSAEYGLFQMRFGMEMGSGQAHTFEDNVKIITNVLEKRIRDAGSEVRLSSKVEKIEKSGNGFKITYEKERKKDIEEADKVVIATPLNVVAKIFPELNIGQGIFYEPTKCFLVKGRLKTERTAIMGVPGPADVANIRLLFVASPDEHQVYPILNDKPIDFSALYEEYEILGERHMEAAFPILKPNGQAPDIKTNIDGAYLCGDYMYYPTLDCAIKTAENAARLIVG